MADLLAAGDGICTQCLDSLTLRLIIAVGDIKRGVTKGCHPTRSPGKRPWRTTVTSTWEPRAATPKLLTTCLLDLTD
jgi:hypothetical protein